MKKIGFALISGLLMGMTPAPLEAWYLAWFALIPLWILIVNKKEESSFRFLIFSENFLIAFAWGCGYHGLALFWITGIHPMTWMGVPWIASLLIAIFCWLFITFWGAALVVTWYILINLCNYKYFSSNIQKITRLISINNLNKSENNYPLKTTPLTNALLRVLIGVSLWCGLESIWSISPLWWTSLSYTQSPHNLAILQLTQLSGPTTITAAIVAINGLIAEVLTIENKTFKIKNKLIILPFSCLIVLHLIGFGMYNRPLINSSQTALKIGIIQGNIPNEIKLYRRGWLKAIEGYTNGYKNLAKEKVDVVLTPETALPFIWKNWINDSSFYSAILDQKIPAWVGALGKEENDFTNSLFTITSNGETFSRYDKTKLVPLGEYIPFQKVLGNFINRLSPLDANLAAGKPKQVFTTPFGQAIVGICYESAFAEHFRYQAAQGGEFIITASNNAHYSNIMPAQHHAQDVMRAIETDRWAARATNTGYSAIVDPRGRTLWISGINTYELHSDTIYRRGTKTLYVRWGDWLTPTLLILGISGWLFFLYPE